VAPSRPVETPIVEPPSSASTVSWPPENVTGPKPVASATPSTYRPGERRVRGEEPPLAVDDHVPRAEYEKAVYERNEAQRAAEMDKLTGLANRNALDRALPSAEADPATAVLVIDGDNFGKVNKRAGQVAGDQAIKDIAQAVKQAASEHGVGERVFRRGGDEMVVLAPQEVAQRVLQRAEELFASRTYGDVDVSLSGGVAATFDQADAAMQSVKQAKKAGVSKPVREFLNYGKFNSEGSPLGQSLNARIRANVEQLRAEGKLDKGFQSFADQRARASEFAKKMVANPLDLDQAKLRNLSGAEVVGLHKVVNDNTLQMEAAARAIAGGLEGDDLASAMRIIDEAQQSTDAALAVIVREKAQTARDLGFFRQVAKNSTDPDVWMVQAKRLLGDKPLPDKVMLEIRRLAREATEVCS
jgi:diguanylate cyclase (GGDEF)-like protein